MIALFGAPGSGKSMQGQMLAARHDWRWLSTGQMLRDSRDLELMRTMKSGELVSDDKICAIVKSAIDDAKGIDNLILDGFPRTLRQAEWITSPSSGLDRKLDLVIHLVVSGDELDRRLQLRGRADDSEAERKVRYQLYDKQLEPIINTLESSGVDLIRISGEGSVGTVHDRIEEVLEQCTLV